VFIVTDSIAIAIRE